MCTGSISAQNVRRNSYIKDTRNNSIYNSSRIAVKEIKILKTLRFGKNIFLPVAKADQIPEFIEMDLGRTGFGELEESSSYKTQIANYTRSQMSLKIIKIHMTYRSSKVI